MPAITHNLARRDGWYSDGGDAGRYAFFAFFVLAIIVFVIMTCAINVKRMKKGRTPVISSYLAPPNYHQSQTAYEGQTTTNLPTYTPAANPNQDVGYYDKNGNFIPSSSIPNKAVGAVEVVDAPMQQPYDESAQPAYLHPEDINRPQSVSDMSYRRPDQPPPTRTYQASEMQVGSSTTEPDLPPYVAPEAPSLPEKSHYKN